MLEGNKNEALRPIMLTNKGLQALLRVERLMDDASRAMAPQPAAPGEAADPAAKRADTGGDKSRDIAAAGN
jgi:hypothetical protein